jgi:PAS domain S-box-containing protein
LLAWRCRALKDKQGNVTGALSTAQDITGRKRSEELIRSIFESVDEGFIIVDREYRILSANRAYAEEVKMPVENIVGKYCYEVSHHSAKPCYEASEECAVRHVFEKGESRTIVHKHYTANGTPVHIKTKAYPLMRDGQGKIVTVIETLIDITQEKHLEDQLRQSQKMEAVGQLAGGVAHDFNNILSAINGYGHITLMNMPKDDPQRLNIEQILEAADRASHLTKDLLLFSRKQISDRKPVDLNEVIGRVENFLARVIGEDIICKIFLHPASTSPITTGDNMRGNEGIMVLADAHQLEQVLMNLATNARDAMPGRGEFTVSTDVVRLDNKFIAIHEYGRIGTYALITISDTGKGMDEATRKRIFEPFFTAKEVGKGTGLGLAVVYGIIKQHEGYINVYSEPGNGTTFKIYLPLIASAVPEENEMGREEKIARGTETVLVAEDDESLRRISSALLTQHGYTVIEAVDGVDAVKKFSDNREAIRLLLFDLVMPNMNGTEAYDEIQKMKPDMKIIFLSGYSPDFVRQRMKLDSGAHLIDKPLSPTELLNKVRSVLDK